MEQNIFSQKTPYTIKVSNIKLFEKNHINLKLNGPFVYELLHCGSNHKDFK
jgi:hypothetical protein